MNAGLKLAQLDSAVLNTVLAPLAANDREDDEFTIQIVVSRVRRDAAWLDGNGDSRAVRSRAMTVDLRKPAANDHFDEVEHASLELVALAAETLSAMPAAPPPAAAVSSDDELVFQVEELEVDLDDSGIVSIQTESLLPLPLAVVERPCAAPPADTEIELDASDLLEIDNEAQEHPRTWLRRAA